MLKKNKLLLFIIIGSLIYFIYTSNLLKNIFPSQENIVLKENVIFVEKFSPKEVSYDTKESKYYGKQLKEIQEKNNKTHKKGALYLKHAISDTFDVEKDPHEYARWSRYYKKKYKDTLKHDENSGENFKDTCYPTLKYDGIHRV